MSAESDIDRIAVTGATGVVGRLTAEHLAGAGLPLLLLARNPANVRPLPHSTVAAFSFDDSASSIAALRGTKTLFMVSAAEDPDRLGQHRTFVDAAAQAGVEHIVYTSFQGASPDATFTLARDHHFTEAHIEASGMSWTFLRDSLYLDFMDALVGEDDVIRGPAGDGRVAAVSRADVAAVAAEVLQHRDEHRGAVYELTGPEALSFVEIAEILTAARGRPVSFHDETVEEAYASRARWNAPAWQTDAWVSTYTAIAAGELSHVSDDVRRITGRAPVSLAEFLSR